MMNLNLSGLKGPSLLIFLLALLLLNLHSASAMITSSVSLRRLSSEAEIIIRGRIISIEGLSTEDRIAWIEVDNVIKGKWENDILHFKLPEVPFPLLNWLEVDEYGLLFLKRVEDKVVPADPFHIMLPVQEGRSISDVLKPRDVLSTVREEMLFTAIGPSAFSKEDQYKQQLQREGARRLSHPELANAFPTIPMNVTAVKYLAEPTYDNYERVIPNNDDVTKALRNLLPTPDVLLRGALFATLLTRGQFDMLEPAVRYINDKERNSTVQNRAQVAHQANDLAWAIGHVSDEKYIPTLGALLKHKDITARRSAITALRTISMEVLIFRNSSRTSPKASEEIEALRSKLVPLFMTALDDQDEEVRNQALWSLSGVINELPLSPHHLNTLDESSKLEAEQKLIAQWKQWWETTRRKSP